MTTRQRNVKALRDAAHQRAREWLELWREERSLEAWREVVAAVNEYWRRAR